MQRFSTVPLQLFRIQARRQVLLRSTAVLEKFGRLYDFQVESDGKIHPMQGDSFIRPNGMACHPLSSTLDELVADFKGDRIFILPEGLQLPPNLVLIHEHSDHYSVQVQWLKYVIKANKSSPQTTTPILPNDFNKALTSLLANLEMINKEEFRRRFQHMQSSWSHPVICLLTFGKINTNICCCTPIFSHRLILSFEVSNKPNRFRNINIII